MSLSERETLLAGAAALGIALDRRQAAQLLDYLVLLDKWNRAVNLTAIRNRSRMLTHHLLDSLSIVAPLRRRPRVERLLDAGSGAGLPGVVLAVAMPEIEVTCVDAMAKKTAFVRQVALELQLGSLRSMHARVEEIDDEFDVVTSRALTSLTDFVSLTRRQLGPDGVWLAMKGRVPTDEIAALPTFATVFHVEPISVPGLDAERCLVWIKPTASH